jgi:class 3 adenylate cyclase
MPHLPGGTVTFLFTDIEGSTKLLHQLGPERYAEALVEHRRLRNAFGAYGGLEVDTQGTPSSSPSRPRRALSGDIADGRCCCSSTTSSTSSKPPPGWPSGFTPALTCSCSSPAGSCSAFLPKA